MLEHIRRSHPKTRQPYIIDLSKDCPSPKEVQSSYLKLRELCAPESTRLFKTQDFKLYGLLDSAKWLYHVSTCLTKAAEAAGKLCDTDATTVVLQEGQNVLQSHFCICNFIFHFRLRTRYELCSV